MLHEKIDLANEVPEGLDRLSVSGTFLKESGLIEKGGSTHPETVPTHSTKGFWGWGLSESPLLSGSLKWDLISNRAGADLWCAMVGFATGLAQLVATVHNIKVDSLLKLIVSLHNVTPFMNDKEVHGRLLGRLMAYKALTLSGRFSMEYHKDNHTSSIKEFISAVICIAYRYQNLQLPAVYLPLEAVTRHIIGAPELQEWFDVAREVFNYFSDDDTCNLIQVLSLIKRHLDTTEDEDDDTESDSQTAFESDNSQSADDEDKDDNGQASDYMEEDDLGIAQILEENNKNHAYSQLLDKLKILTLLRISTHKDPGKNNLSFLTYVSRS
ncbi:uncharacterized protein HKW66_Vig0065440 [Vigna angularis]|uniref:Uncharacterized protein n=1 Tax=Phaseolus angularis TaxID=3914 RepID=A0A8T0K8M2_PHAAN|nr:uncharacterized protein HKW66_Vig0065440 [Vigna angularis]